MDAAMTQQGLNEMGVDDVILFSLKMLEILFGPEFDTGASINITILSVPEGMINQLNIHWFILLAMLF
ncbi:MAG: hypothetical protein ACLR43_10840 [Faecalibacillus faecis]